MFAAVAAAATKGTLDVQALCTRLLAASRGTTHHPLQGAAGAQEQVSTRASTLLDTEHNMARACVACASQLLTPYGLGLGLAKQVSICSCMRVSFTSVVRQGNIMHKQCVEHECLYDHRHCHPLCAVWGVGYACWRSTLYASMCSHLVREHRNTGTCRCHME